MLKKHAHAFIVLLWAFDITMLAASFTAAYGLRFFAPSIIPAPGGDAPFAASVRLFALAVPIWSFCFASLGLYGPRRIQARRSEIYSLAKATALGTLLLVFTQYFSGEDRYSRGVILLFAATSFAFLSATRLLARQILAAFRARGFNKRRAIVIGANRVSTELIQRLQLHPEFGIEICAVLGADADDVGSEVAGYRVGGTYDELAAVIKRTHADQVYLALAQAEHARLASIHRTLATETVDIRVVPDLVDLITLRGGVEDMDGLAIVHLQAGPLIGFDAWIKRGFDLVVTTIALAMLSPVMLLCALLVKVTSRGPVLYRQERIGLDGHAFKLLKFRSMPVNAEAKTGAVWAQRGDERSPALRLVHAQVLARRATAAVQRPQGRYVPRRPAPRAPGIHRRVQEEHSPLQPAPQDQGRHHGARPGRGLAREYEPREAYRARPPLHRELVAVARRQDPRAHRAWRLSIAQRVLSRFVRGSS